MDLNQIPTRSDRELYVKDKCLNILNRYGNDKKLHDEQLARFVANEMEKDYEPVVFVAEKPGILLEYEALKTEKDKLEWDKKFPDWRLMDDVQAFYKQRSEVQSRNQSNKSFLQELEKALSTPCQEKTRIREMLAKFDVKGQPVEEVRVDWNN